MVSASFGGAHDPLDGKVVRLGCSAGEKDFILPGTKQRGERFARSFDNFRGLQAMRMIRMRIAPVMAHRVCHRIDHRGIDRS